MSSLGTPKEADDMVARSIDAAEGYRLFQRFSGTVTLDEINEYLRGLGLRGVSPRMLVHYQRLYRHDYRSYLPINRLDIALAGEDAWSDELQARYPEIAQPTGAEVIWNARVYEAQVTSLGVSTATVLGDEVPTAGSSVVLRLLTTGIERTGLVTRSDRASGLFHIAFDPFTSVPLAPENSPVTARLRVELPDSAENLVAIADVILSLDRFLVRADLSRTSLTRVRRVSMSSPLDIVIVGGDLLGAAIAILGAVIVLRKRWYEGTKTKYEARGIYLDNLQRVKSAQKEADTELGKILHDEVNKEEAPLLGSLEQPELPLGSPNSLERQQLSDAAQSALDLPASIEIEPMSGDAPD